MFFLVTAILPVWHCSKCTAKYIYHNGWIDFNKNGKKDIYEGPKQPVEKRIENLLSQMNLNEKSCQMATLYGYGRVLKDEMPTPNWKNEIWKDGIANIDEELSSNKLKTQYSYPETQTGKQNIQVSVDVANTGKLKGDEVVQLYIRDIISSVTTYETQLRGFERISLQPGEKR